MLMEDRQIALNDIIVACLGAADRYRDGIDLCEDPGLRALFDRLAEERTSVADALAGHVRVLDALPRQPDADLEQVQRLASRFKAKISVNEQVTVLDERLQAERHIESLIDTALQYELPESTTRYLGSVREATREAQNRLIALRRTLAT